MYIKVLKDYDEMSTYAAGIVSAQIKEKPACILGLPTGGTPVGMYKKLVAANKSGELDFAKVTTFNLDEYYPIDPEHEQSYHYFMQQNLHAHINIDPKNVHVPCGNGKDPNQDGRDYDKMIDEAGGLDLMVLGSGVNGHIGFNEPDEELVAGTHLTSLTQNTIEVNSRFFDSIDEVPTQAVTMGMASILKAKKIIILINGKNKAEIINVLASEKITTKVPASMLHMHNDVTLITDVETMSSVTASLDNFVER